MAHLLMENVQIEKCIIVNFEKKSKFCQKSIFGKNLFHFVFTLFYDVTTVEIE